MRGEDSHPRPHPHSANIVFANAGPTDDVSWSKDHNAMISTSPLILEDSIVVKTTDGLIAYSHSGVEQWKWSPSQTLLLEISPLYHHEPTNLIVTGWTDGQVTAHQSENGELAWTISTDSPMWGITGRIHESQGNCCYSSRDWAFVD